MRGRHSTVKRPQVFFAALFAVSLLIMLLPHACAISSSFLVSAPLAASELCTFNQSILENIALTGFREEYT